MPEKQPDISSVAFFEFVDLFLLIRQIVGVVEANLCLSETLLYQLSVTSDHFGSSSNLCLGMGKPSKAKPNLLPGKLVRQHLKSCQIKAGRCGLCCWAKKMDAWRKKCATPWLQCTLKKKAARLGCASCALAGLSGPWAEFEQPPLGLRLHHLKRHEASKAHLSSINSEEAEAAPDMEIFREALKKMRSGNSSRDGGVYSDKKHQIRWCLSEACLQVARSTLREALAIAITRDERKGRLLLRWRACRPNFTAASGVLGFLPVQGFSDDLALKTEKAIKAFCTPSVGLPRGFVAAEADRKFDQAAESSIRQKTSILITDAASPEMLASSLLSGRRPYAGSGICSSYLAAVKVVGKDAAHASCRLIKRPFSASPQLESLMVEYINGPDSFCQKVWHSPLYTTWWQELVTVGPSSLSCAKHRFASYALPLGRLSDNVRHMVSLCHKIALIRGTCGQWASLLLTHMSGKKLALLSMAADAAQTCSDLTRSMDDEGADISELHSRVQKFAYSIEALFLSERVLELPTYTKALCDAVEMSPVRILHNGRAREICITAADKMDALKIMKACHVIASLLFL